jgi:hypothetical protein
VSDSIKIRTKNLEGDALDCAVAKALGFNPNITTGAQRFERLSDEDKQDTEYANFILNAKPRLTWDNPVRGTTCHKFSTEWDKAGPIIEREKIDVFSCGDIWDASTDDRGNNAIQSGPTPLIAAMRCFVEYKLGPEVTIPMELAQDPVPTTKKGMTP